MLIHLSLECNLNNLKTKVEVILLKHCIYRDISINHLIIMHIKTLH